MRIHTLIDTDSMCVWTCLLSSSSSNMQQGRSYDELAWLRSQSTVCVRSLEREVI